MVDFSKHKHGDVVVVHCCDECARKAGVNPKRPADSGKASWLCDVCGHRGIGSLTDCEIGDWLRLRPLQPNADFAIYAEADDDSGLQVGLKTGPMFGCVQFKLRVRQQ